MSYINFVVITDTPARLRDFLIARGIIEQATDSSGTFLRGTRPGLEWVRVPNPIVTDPGSGGDPMEPGYVPPTYDTRNVYLCKFAHESLANEVEGIAQTETRDGKTVPKSIMDRTKFGQYVKTADAAVDSIELRDGSELEQGHPKQIDGMVAYQAEEGVWLVEDTEGRMGVWQ